MKWVRVNGFTQVLALSGLCLMAGTNTAVAQVCGDGGCDVTENNANCPQDCPGYLKHDPPPDANKVAPATDLTCWLATTANMLAGAGYGEGGDEQARAEEIYGELKLEYTGLN